MSGIILRITHIMLTTQVCVLLGRARDSEEVCSKPFRVSSPLLGSDLSPRAVMLFWEQEIYLFMTTGVPWKDSFFHLSLKPDWAECEEQKIKDVFRALFSKHVCSPDLSYDSAFVPGSNISLHFPLYVLVWIWLILSVFAEKMLAQDYIKLSFLGNALAKKLKFWVSSPLNEPEHPFNIAPASCVLLCSALGCLFSKVKGKLEG